MYTKDAINARVKSLSLRLPGGDLFNQYVGTRNLKNTEWDFLFRMVAEHYWHGTERGKAVLRQNIEKYIKDNIYDLDIISLPMAVMVGDFAYDCLLDLVFPYLTGHKELSGEGTYEEFGVQVDQGDVVIDAGANIGIFSAFAVRYRGGGIAHAFEPVSRTANLLKKTIEANGITDKVIVNRMALGACEDETEISIKGDELGSSTMVSDLKRQGDYSERIHVTTLDEYVKKNQLDRVDFIKADIEGNERFMLEGAAETLRQFKPKLAICTYHLPDDPQVLTYIIKKANPGYHIEYGREKLYAE